MANIPNLDNCTGGARRWLLSVAEPGAAPAELPTTATGWLRALAQAHGAVVGTIWPALDIDALGEAGARALDLPGLVVAARGQAVAHGREYISLADLALALGEHCGQGIEPAIVAAAAGVAAGDKPTMRSRPISGSPHDSRAPQEPAPTADRRGAPRSGPRGREARRAMFGPSAPAPQLAPGDYTQPVGGPLGEFGIDLTHEAYAGHLPVCVGRATELETILETLCRETKANPVLLGPAGSGKTALAEALAQRLVAGEVPAPLRGKRLVSISAANFVAGAGIVGMMEERVEEVVEQALAQGAILFIDELHMITGAGASRSNTAGTLGNALKPALSRPGFACIGATTPSEYEQHIITDTALERRFQPVTIECLSAEATLEILAQREKVAKEKQRPSCPPEVQAWLVDYADRQILNRHFPDKAIDLYEQCVAHALNRGLGTVDLATAQVVVERLLGVPLDVGQGLDELAEAVVGAGLLHPESAVELEARLMVSLRGMDCVPARPNAVVALLDEAAYTAPALADLLASRLLGSKERQISVDLAGLVYASDVAALSGNQANGRKSIFQDLEQMPWSVLVLRGLELTSSAVRDAVARMLNTGLLDLENGRRLSLSHTLVLLVMERSLAEPKGKANLGFRERPAPTSGGLERVEALLGERLAREVDVVSEGSPYEEFLGARAWLLNDLLPGLLETLAKRRLTVTFDPQLVDYLLALHDGGFDRREWERTFDRVLSPALANVAPAAHEPARAVYLRVGADGLEVEEVAATPRPVSEV